MTQQQQPYERLKRDLASGWNTWNTRSVLSHVLLPHGFQLQLGVKEYKNTSYLREALIGRQSEGETIRPGPRAYDGSYTELTLHWQDLELRIRTATDGDDLVVLAEPIRGQRLPAKLIVECGILWNRPGLVRRRDGIIRGEFADRDVPVYSTADHADEFHVPAASPYYALTLDGPVGLSTGRPRDIDEIHEILHRQRKMLQLDKAMYGDRADIYDAMQTCLAWDTIYDPAGDRVITPVSRIWNDQGYKLFCWDTYFAAYMFMPDHKELAYANAIEMTRSATAAGFVPNFDWSGTIVSRDRSQPPVGSLVVSELYRKYKEKWLLEEVFERLYAWNRWWPEHRQIEDGLLAWGSDPAEPVTGNVWETDGVNDRFGAALESGLDNSPMYDDIPFDKKKHCLMLADVGLMSLFVMDCLALADIADAIERSQEAATLRASAERFGAGIERLWDEETGIFRNLRTDTGRFSERLSPTNFYPMLTPYVTERQAQRMVNEHLCNPDEFWGDWVLPSIARNDPAYPEQEYWRGRIWAPMDFLVYLGLHKQGLLVAKRALADKSEALLRKEWLEHGHVHENYNADTGEGCDKPTSDRYYHWGGLLGFLALMEAGLVMPPRVEGGITV
ncbi:hypothetical protein MO973_39390 [Paenibacillus sp. TRM 82003]|nr:hypothetical protein [Paenibacillus sp. TRM 82003]